VRICFIICRLDVSHNHLQTAIDRLVEWAKLWQLQISIPKCSAFRIMNTQWRISDDVADIQYNIEGNTLFCVDQVRDLGVHHDCPLKHDKHI